MLSNGFSPQYSQTPVIKRENYNFSLYATPPDHYVGVARRDSQYPESQRRESRPAYSIYNTTTASSVASMMPQKRPSPSDGNGNGNGNVNTNASPAKHVKTEHPEEFSNTVKKRLASSTRTGQACDRCKVRKIRCDGLPGGCSPCLQNNTECRTTDRITGRATSRGYVEGLEQQNRDLQHRLHEAEQRLAQSGLDGKAINGYNGAGGSGYGYNPPPTAPSTWSPPDAYTPQPSLSGANGSQETNMFRALPVFRPGSFGDNYLGVSPGNSKLSSIKGTALSILGMEIDIADFESADMDEPDASLAHQQLYNKSYQAFLQSALNINPRIEKIELPPRAEGMKYAEWYFRVLNPYTPVLHKPTFIAVATRMYDDPTFRPTTAETVMVHMVFAIMYFQYATRNYENAAQQADLTHSHTVQDVQALTLICLHLRNFPKPGASWILTQTTMSLAIELGLHRSAKRWASDAVPNPLDVEMRKRIFWAILSVHVALSGKLGRPMTLRIDDFDVELPERLDDELLSENGLDTSRPGRCSHEIGLQAFSIVPLYMELYSTIYAVRRQPETYQSTVSKLEAKLRAWKEGLPQGLVNGEAGSNEQEGRVFALYAHMWELEFRLLLRHPSVSMTNDSTFNAESMDICAEASRQMLGLVRQLQKYKSLDTTWYNSAVYVMAITTTLFAQWDKRGSNSPADLDMLEADMDVWLDIMGEVGALLGSGTRLRDAVRTVTNSTLSLLHRTRPGRSSYSQGTNAIDKSKSSPQRSNSTSTYASNAPNYYETPAGNNNVSTYSPTDGHMAHSQTPYPTATQYSNYSEPAPTAITYTPEDNSGVYTTYPANSDAVGAPLLAAFAAQAHNQVQTQNQVQSWQRSPHLADSGSLAWHQYTNTVTGALEPRDRYSASALMALGGRELSDTQTGVNSQASAALTAMDLNAQNGVGMDQGGGQMGGHLGGQISGGMEPWPLNIFEINQGGSLS